MEERQLNEKESLELITQMINSSKKNMKVGQGNIMLIWGYFTTILSVCLFTLISLTHNFMWSWGWMFLFLLWPAIAYKQNQNTPRVVTYTDKVISQVWQVIGWMFGFTFITIGIVEYLFIGYADFIIMLPLSLIYSGLGISITGIIIQERWMIYSPLVAFILAIYMLTIISMGKNAVLLWYLYFGLAFVFMMIIPGHIVNHKAKKECLKN